MLEIAGGIVLAFLVLWLLGGYLIYRDQQRQKREYYRGLQEQRRDPLRGYDVNGYPIGPL